MVLGVTGGSGCGKSTVTKQFTELGAKKIDADMVARDVVCPGKPALAEIAAAFGEQYITETGELKRKKLGELVFSDSEKLAQLNQITHRYITEEVKHRLEAMRGELVVLDAALLYESGLSRLCSRTLCVWAEESVRVRRITKRDDLTEQRALERIRSQKTEQFYREHADDFMENNGSEEELAAEVKQYWKQLVELCE